MMRIRVEYFISKDSEELKCIPCAYIKLCVQPVEEHGHIKLPPEFRIREKEPFTGHMTYLSDIFVYNHRDNTYELETKVTGDNWEDVVHKVNETIESLKMWVHDIINKYNKYIDRLNELEKHKPKDLLLDINP